MHVMRFLIISLLLVSVYSCYSMERTNPAVESDEEDLEQGNQRFSINHDEHRELSTSSRGYDFHRVNNQQLYGIRELARVKGNIQAINDRFNQNENRGNCAVGTNVGCFIFLWLALGFVVLKTYGILNL